MKIYLIMPVRNADPEVMQRANKYKGLMEFAGHDVHYPPRDAPQLDPTGRAICETHRAAMEGCDEVHVLWDVDSKGSHFDLGMAYALRKRIVPVDTVVPDGPGKSYWKAVITADSAENQERPCMAKTNRIEVTDEMVARFLLWKLPATFSPDCGIDFDGRNPDQWNPSKSWPVGTNLFTATEARQMLDHALNGAASSAPAAPSKSVQKRLAVQRGDAETVDGVKP